MTNRITIKIVSDKQRSHAIDLIRKAPAGYAVQISEETRSQAQNRLMWPLIADMQAQDAHMASFAPDQVKLRFLNALDNEMQLLPELWGGGQFVAGQRSSNLTKSNFTDLIELMFKWGAENEIKWSRRSEDTREAMQLAGE